jgi:hypothetical protein
MVFAPVKEYQMVINQVCKKLLIKIEAMEPESIAVMRDPNPILGIAKKTDISGKDEEVLNITVVPTAEKRKLSMNLAGVAGMAVMTLVMLFLVVKYGTRKTVVQTPAPTPTITISTTSPTPTVKMTVKAWADLKVMVQNGTTTAGLAGKTATVLKNGGLNLVESGNADSSDHPTNKLIFKDNLLKENYLKKFKALITVGDDKVEIDNSIQYDVIFILGNN